jgi:hypothetical protein
MRLGRILLLASLAQFLGLSALASVLAEHPAFTKDLSAAEDGQGRNALAPVSALEAGISYTSHVRGASQAIYALTALAATPLKHSLWMVAPAIRTVPVPRPRRHSLLRC